MKISKARIAEARANLEKAPAKEDVGSVRAAVLQMRGELMAALVEKNWSFAELRDWLASQGIEVSLAALQRYLVGIRAAKKAARGQNADLPPEAKATGLSAAPAMATPGVGQGAVKANPPRVIPPMPGSVRVMSRPSEAGGQPVRAPNPTAPRASSFPVRPDREKI